MQCGPPICGLHQVHPLTIPQPGTRPEVPPRHILERGCSWAVTCLGELWVGPGLELGGRTRCPDPARRAHSTDRTEAGSRVASALGPCPQLTSSPTDQEWVRIWRLPGGGLVWLSLHGSRAGGCSVPRCWPPELPVSSWNRRALNEEVSGWVSEEGHGTCWSCCMGKEALVASASPEGAVHPQGCHQASPLLPSQPSWPIHQSACRPGQHSNGSRGMQDSRRVDQTPWPGRPTYFLCSGILIPRRTSA